MIQLITQALGFCAAALNFKKVLSTTKNNKSMTEKQFAIVAFVIIVAFAFAAICYLFNQKSN